MTVNDGNNDNNINNNYDKWSIKTKVLNFEQDLS